MSEITSETLLKRTAPQVSCVVDHDTMVMYLPTGRYFSIDLVGSRIWELIETPQSARSLAEILCREYVVTLELCQRDTLAFLNHLLEWGLVEQIQVSQ